ncbi:MAG: helix-turn-helix transcriptional regulator [Bermanella sp.]
MQLPYPEDAFLLGYLLEVNRDAEGWQRFMVAMHQHFNLRSSHLMVMNSQTQAMRFHIDAGEPVSAEFAAMYVEKYVHSDEIMAAVKVNPIGKFYATNMLKDAQAIYQNDHYRDWATPQGIANGAAACVYVDGDWSCILASNRNAQQGPYSQQEIERMNALLPFVEKAVQSSFVLSESSKNERRAKSIVGSFRIPVAVLTEFGELWATNSAMEKLLKHQSSLYIKDKCLHLKNPSQDKLLNTGIFQAAKRADGIDMTIDEAEKISLDNNTALGFQELIDDEDGQKVFLGVMVYAISNELLATISEHKLTSLFLLTPAEARVCHLIMSGYSIKAIASSEGKSVHTVREQLNNTFQKTGCSSQVSLVNLISSIPY